MSENGIGKSAQPRAQIPAPQYTLQEAIGVCLAMSERALAEVRALAEPGLKAQVRRLEERIRAIEQMPLLEDAGIWNGRSEYYPGNVVTHDGSAWVAKTLHSHGEPGKCDAWRLMVKRGRDGKDSR